MDRDEPVVDPDGLLERLKTRFAPDALIQAAGDRLEVETDEFIEILTDEMYRDLRETLLVKDWEVVARVFSQHHLGGLARRTWHRFATIAEEHFSKTTAFRLAPTVAELANTPFQPRAILSFNAEPLFYSLIHSQIASSQWTADGQSAPSPVLTQVRDSIHTRRADRLTYYYCHGLLPIPRERARFSPTDKLVFSETAYLQLANTSFSWQSATFLEMAMYRSLVFIGVSLSDANMRRWLTWVHENRLDEIQQHQEDISTSTTHYWITKDPGSAVEKRWTEAAVAHLGVRVVWIREWEEVTYALRRLLNLEVEGAQEEE